MSDHDFIELALFYAAGALFIVKLTHFILY